MKSPEHLFVYGTLREGAGHPMHATLDAGARRVGAARVRGRLYRLDGYPGLVLDPAADWVHGELYRLHDAGVLDPLDRYEGAHPTDPEPLEFRRIQASVVDFKGEARAAWIYVYEWAVDEHARIGSGDYLRPDS
ncbi:MAG: gamma-glutamylcyclotransferase family protein [Myxococcota bacterium]